MAKDDLMRHLLFSMDRLEFEGGGQALVCGRCCGDAIKDGDQAQLMVFLEESGSVSASEPIAITFRDFEMYGKKVDTIHSGYTAGISVPNHLAMGLRLGWFLKGENA